MSTYGFTLNADGNILSFADKVNKALSSMGLNAKVGVDGVKGQFDSLLEAAKGVAEAMAAAFAVREVVEFGKELMHITSEYQNFDNVIKYTSQNSADATQNLTYIKGAIDRLHLPMQQAYQSFAEMQAGFYGTGIEGQKLRSVFEGVAEAATVLHLDPQRFESTMLFLKEMGEMGTVQARQMRSLAMSLPGAMSIAAKAMNMGTAQFHEAMKKGEIKSADFIPKFTTQLSKQFAPGLPNAGNSLQAKMNDANNAMEKLKLSVGNAFIPVFTEILTVVDKVFSGIKSKWDSISGSINFDGIIKTMENVGRQIFAYISPVLNALKPVFAFVYNGVLEIISSLSQFQPEIQAVAAFVQMLFTKLASYVGPVLQWIFHSVAVTIDILHTLYKLLERLGVISLIGKIAQGVWWVLEQVGKAIVWLYDHTLKPIFDKVAEWYGKLKEWLNIKGTADVKAQFEQVVIKKPEGKKAEPDFGMDKKGKSNPVIDNAVKTTDINGPSGGLNQAKVINLNFNAPIQKIDKVDVKQGEWQKASVNAAEEILKIMMNMAYGQAGSM